MKKPKMYALKMNDCGIDCDGPSLSMGVRVVYNEDNMEWIEITVDDYGRVAIRGSNSIIVEPYLSNDIGIILSNFLKMEDE